MSFEALSLKANGDIRPSRFVKLDTSEDFAALEADANEAVIGISGVGTQSAPLPGVTALAASDELFLRYHGEGQMAMLEIGSGGITRGAALKSDADGKGVAAATTGTTKQHQGAIALESAAAGEIARVLVKIDSYFPALS